MTETVLSIALALAVVFAGAGLGRVTRSVWARRDSYGAMSLLVIEVAMGLGVLSLVFFAISAAQLLSPVSIWVAVAPAALLGFVELVTATRRLARRPTFHIEPVAAYASALLALLLIMALMPALAPPASGDWDSLAYHLAIPKLYLKHGGFYYISFSSHSNFPFLMEMLYLPGLAAGDPVAAKLVNYPIFLLLVGAVGVMTRRHFGTKLAWLAALILAGMPIVLWEAGTAYVDLATALYTVVAICLLLDHFDSADARCIVGCGIAAGFAASTKMTAIVLGPLLAVWLVLHQALERRRVEWSSSFALVVIAVLICSPWYIKSILYTGNPFYPFFYSIFGGRDWTASLAANYAMLQSKFGMGHGFAWFVLLPFDLTFNAAAFYDRPGLFVGPIFLVAVPFLLLGRYGSRKLLGIALFFAIQLVIWFELSQQSRYLIPGFALLAVVVASIAYRDNRLRPSRIALWATFTAVAIFGIATLWVAITESVPVVIGSISRAAYLRGMLDTYSATEFINAHTPSQARVALFGDTRGFYLNRDYVWADPGHNTAFTRDFKSVRGLIQYLKSQKVTHVLINYRYGFPAPEQATGNTSLIHQAIAKGVLKEVFPGSESFSGVAVYQIK